MTTPNAVPRQALGRTTAHQGAANSPPIRAGDGIRNEQHGTERVLLDVRVPPARLDVHDRHV
jgi:hypothetical protein